MSRLGLGPYSSKFSKGVNLFELVESELTFSVSNDDFYDLVLLFQFVEIDPVHEEILRKKEEQDREKPYRHLFRFPHMGMWTKLRPGIWNFLEKVIAFLIYLFVCVYS